MTLRRRKRLRIACLVLLSLLFQQVAMAAYACTMTRMPADPGVMSEDCAEMGMQQVTDSPALCAKHCAPDLSVAADHVGPGVPALALPPPGFDPVLTASTSHAALQRATHGPLDRSDPPPRLRYCSLLI